MSESERHPDEYLRQARILTPADLRGLDVDIVGAGSLGGAILLCLVKMGFGLQNRITVTDFDRCEPHNLGTQWFRPAHVLTGEAKVDALAELIDWVAEREVVAVNERFTGSEDRRLGPIVILAVDSLDERWRIWSRLRGREDVDLLLDARMGAEILEIRAVDPRGDVEAYEASLEEGEAWEEPCTRRAILYTVLGAASFAGSMLRAWARREPLPSHVFFDFRNFFLEVGEWMPPRG